jgi:membrane-associated protein
MYLILTFQFPLTSLSISNLILQYGVWVYLLTFVIILLSSTIVGGAIPDNTFLILAGAVTNGNSLSMTWLFVAAVGGGFVGYEINYWSGKRFGLPITREIFPTVLRNKNVKKALDIMNRFGISALIFSRFMPDLNLPSFLDGVNAMDYRRYAVFNLVSSVVWCGILLMLGYYIGSLPLINAYLDYLTDLFIVILVAGIIFMIVIAARNYIKRKVIISPNLKE